MGAGEFAGWMSRLGPFAPDRRVAVAVSGGADSTALALLSAGWGRALALVVDHGVRAQSAEEAAVTLERLRRRGVEGRVLTLRGLEAGPGLQARARALRYAALSSACEAAGLIDLLLGHHARDQAETVAIRRGAGSGPAGLSGMAALRVTGPVRLLRPLLDVPPGRLRATLHAAGMAWIEDPSNADLRYQRARLRAGGDAGASSQSGGDGARRRADEAASWPAGVAVFPAGYAVLAAGEVDPRALSSAVWTVSGRCYPPSPDAVRQASGAATLHGVRIVLARGRRFVVREEAATAAPVQACAGAIWDGRFRVDEPGGSGAELGLLGRDAARLRDWSRLPASVLRTFPALRREGALWAVPHLAYPSVAACASTRIAFRPAHPIGGAPFVPSADASGVHLSHSHTMFVRDGGSRSEPDGGLGRPDMPED